MRYWMMNTALLDLDCWYGKQTACFLLLLKPHLCKKHLDSHGHSPKICDPPKLRHIHMQMQEAT